MNIFRLLGDSSHLLAIFILLIQMLRTRSCAGISGRSQLLYTLVFLARYLDLFTSYISAYNTIMKAVFIVCSMLTVFLIYVWWKNTYDQKCDTFRIEFLVIPALILAFAINHDFSAMEIAWTFSIYLESVAILPQLFMLYKLGDAESITYYYLFWLGLYRALYIANWIYRYYTDHFYDIIAIVAGCLQTFLYLDFFYLFAIKAIKGELNEYDLVPLTDENM